MIIWPVITGILLGLLMAKTSLSQSGIGLMLWAIPAVVFGVLAKDRKTALKSGAAFGFFLFFSSSIFGYLGSIFANQLGQLALWSTVLSLPGALFSLVLSLIGKSVTDSVLYIKAEILHSTNCRVSFENLKEKSKEIDSFLLKHCDSVCWTSYDQDTFRWKLDEQFLKKMEQSKPYLIKKTVDNVGYGDMIVGNRPYRHYFFHLRGVVKKWLQPEYPVVAAHGLWNPIFYKGKKMTAASMAYGPVLAFNISKAQRLELEQSGVRFDGSGR